MITRGVRRQNEARREFLREPSDDLIVFGNACNSVANARKFFVRLATLLQTPKSFSGHLQRSCKGPFSHFGVCRTSARALFPILAFAELLQARFSPFWRLQNFCKGPFSHFGVCRTSASALFPILAFAELLQGPFFPFWRLQNFCKRAFPHFGVCRTSASAVFSILTFAELLQSPKSFSEHLQRSCKHFQKLCAAFSALPKTFFRDTDPHSFAELAFGMCFVQIFCIVRSMYAHCEGVQIDIPSIFAPQ